MTELDAALARLRAAIALKWPAAHGRKSRPEPPMRLEPTNPTVEEFLFSRDADGRPPKTSEIIPGGKIDVAEWPQQELDNAASMGVHSVSVSQLTEPSVGPARPPMVPVATPETVVPVQGVFPLPLPASPHTPPAVIQQGWIARTLARLRGLLPR